MEKEGEGCIFYGPQEVLSIGKPPTKIISNAQLFTRIPCFESTQVKKDCAINQRVRELIRRRSKKHPKEKSEEFDLRCNACGFRGKCRITLVPAKSDTNSI